MNEKMFIPTKIKVKESDEINYELRKLNPYFRLFGLNEIIEYLQIKEIENKFITNHEG